MSTIAAPATEAALAEIVRQARADASPLEIRGGGTRGALGRPVHDAQTLSLARLGGVTLYEPGALTLVARAGTPVREVEETLRAQGQRLAFEPMDHRALLGTKGAPSIGAVVACNISGPRRVQAGACRDALLGVRFVDGTGTVIKNGGRVMKNVTGFDLVKLLCGSYGTLGVLSEVALKVLPEPEHQATLAIEGLSVEAAIEVLSQALASPFEVTGAAHCPGGKKPALTALRVEGFATQVDYRLERLRETVAAAHDTKILKGSEHQALWRGIRDVEEFADTSQPVWRLCVKPGDAPAIAATLGEKLDAQLMFDWGGGLIWVQVANHETAGAEVIRRSIADHGGYWSAGGHATLVRAPEALRAAVPVFQPQAARLSTLSQSIRAKFDPDAILNPGRMAA